MKRVFFIILLLFISFTQICNAADYYRWDNPQRIRVYIHDTPYLDVKPLVKTAFAQWTHFTKNKIIFSYSTTPKNSDIEIEFIDRPTNVEHNKAVGYTIPSYYVNTNLLAQVTITISVKDAEGKKLDEGILYGAIVHEIGHALGLTDHSLDIKSVMYPYTLPNVEQGITEEDLNRLKILYRY